MSNIALRTYLPYRVPAVVYIFTWSCVPVFFYVLASRSSLVGSLQPRPSHVTCSDVITMVFRDQIHALDFEFAIDVQGLSRIFETDSLQFGVGSWT